MKQFSNSLTLFFLIYFFTITNAQSYNLLFPYIFNETQENNIYFLMRDDNTIKPYDKNNLWLISKNDKPLVGLQLEITKKELDEKAARLKYLECTKPDKTRIEAQKKAEEKLKSKNY